MDDDTVLAWIGGLVLGGALLIATLAIAGLLFVLAVLWHV